MSKHTPGPWSIRPVFATNNNRSAVFREGIPGYVQRLDDMRGTFEHADAALMAAAPDLLEACQTLVEWFRREDHGGEGQAWRDKRGTPEGEAAWRDWYDENLRLCDLAKTQARAAIAKALPALDRVAMPEGR